MNILDSMNMKDEVKEVLVKERKEKRKILDKCCYNLDVKREKRIKKGCWDGTLIRWNGSFFHGNRH